MKVCDGYQLDQYCLVIQCNDNPRLYWGLCRDDWQDKVYDWVQLEDAMIFDYEAGWHSLGPGSFLPEIRGHDEARNNGTLRRCREQRLIEVFGPDVHYEVFGPDVH